MFYITLINTLDNYQYSYINSFAFNTNEYSLQDINCKELVLEGQLLKTEAKKI